MSSTTSDHPVPAAAGAAPPGPILEVRGIQKTFNAGTDHEVTAIRDISFTVEKGEFVCVVGPSGAGKTTLLRAIAGLAAPSRGSTVFEGQVLSDVPQKLGLVFQDYGRSLYPWFTNGRNVALPLAARGVPKAARATRVAEVLAAVGLGHVERQYPWELSGGMQQRVAIARALSYRPELLLMDEPFASVDAQTRFDLEDLILRVRRDLGVTVVLVTHDIDEAIYLSDRIVVLSASPSVVREIVDVPLGPERTQSETRASTAFVELRQHLLALVMPKGERP
ncbi:ABC transporter ATP-binding protein [Citricoccus sp. SGAir0253]|uniref:ABC transporter ATP-binding protein n=1 Tax=Citricoccus sp. SGAir0253 TaxID=2567881 RepID=UPI0010CD31C3|nr:ABC transporter ATP-binding protein [Citricoccus sp. SGAir0253]QCU77565.1 ABC transporter ATP-binding protein [Citricoccus sp. SGAir0253]